MFIGILVGGLILAGPPIAVIFLVYRIHVGRAKAYFGISVTKRLSNSEKAMFQPKIEVTLKELRQAAAKAKLEELKLLTNQHTASDSAKLSGTDLKIVQEKSRIALENLANAEETARYFSFDLDGDK